MPPPSPPIETDMEPRRSLKKHSRATVDGDPSTSFIERRGTLTKDINNLRNPQRLYMPGVVSLLDAIDSTLLADRPENVDLYLPSSLPPALRSSQCVDGLPRIEYRLRFAEATNALHHVRLYCRLIHALKFKTQAHIANTQKTGTRTRSLFEKAKTKQTRAVTTYRASRKAIEDLAPNEEFGLWKGTLQDLKESDLRGPGPEDFETSTSQFIQSWIWTTAVQTSISTEDSDLNTALRIEWCKSQERAKRYEEEVELVVEEMRRTLVTFELNAHDWDEKAASLPHRAPSLDPAVVSGATAYAYKQADIQRKLIGVFFTEWYDVLESQPLAASWLKKYPRPPADHRHRLVSNVKHYHSNIP